MTTTSISLIPMDCAVIPPTPKLARLRVCSLAAGAPPGPKCLRLFGHRSDESAGRRVAGALPSLVSRLDQVATQHGMARDELELLGFSQGAITVAWRRLRTPRRLWRHGADR